jgi:hypothetical protein
MISQQQADRIEKNQERILTLLHKAIGNVAVAKSWGDHDDACKILNRSKSWYQDVRNGGSKNKHNLIEGKDWKRVGNDVEYFLPSIEHLRETIINKKAPAVTEAN